MCSVSVRKERQPARRIRRCFLAVVRGACGRLLCRSAFARCSGGRLRNPATRGPLLSDILCGQAASWASRVDLALGTSLRGRVHTASATRIWLSLFADLGALLRLVGGRGCRLPHLEHLHKIGIGQLSRSLPEPLTSFLRVSQLRGHTLLLRLQILLFFFQTLDAGEEVALLAGGRAGRLSRGARPRQG